jgi:hypothetical protein
VKLPHSAQTGCKNLSKSGNLAAPRLEGVPLCGTSISCAAKPARTRNTPAPAKICGSDHNAGKSPHTAKYRPWQLIWYCAFAEKAPALAFEKYLKSHSGRVFTHKRLTTGRSAADESSKITESD